ncbi:MAG TPA: zinc-dependent metalloprotease family protein [Gemmatimonadales bacterium]|nr:zinc-dependent metalloprotease family protein [Gemmatimonadales bacterium]
MPLTSRKYLCALLLVTMLACNEGPSGLSTGNLSVNVSGLPGGSSADLLVTGPGGYSQAVTGSQILTDLAPGSYAITANNVTVGSTMYTGTPPIQVVPVNGSTASAFILYSVGPASLSVTINGLGTGTDASVTITGPNSYSSSIVASQTLTSLTPGTYTITAQDVVASGGTTHSPTPATQDVVVPTTGAANATVTYAPPSTGLLNLRIAGLYLTQSTQTYAGGVPLVKDRNGILRVFVVANRTNTAAPAVRVQVYNSSNAVVSTVVIPPPSLSVPTMVDESQLIYSWNTPISGTLIQPGFRVDAEVDPAGVIAETDDADNLLAPPPPVVQTVPALNLTFVPVIQQRHAARGDVGGVTSGNKDQFLSLTQRMHPIGTLNSTVRAPYTTTTMDTLQAQNTNNAWTTILAEIDAIRILENPSRYYYGVAKVSYSSGVAGVAYVSGVPYSERTALGWDYLPSGAEVAAHELGHNWGRDHAPCGGPTGVDPAYPYAGGSTGVYGLDVAAQVLKPPSSTDVMGYCNQKWISDYTYNGVMSYLISPPPSAPLVAAAVNQAVQPCLLVWGHIRNGELVLEPAFQVNARPSLPPRPGPYNVEARAADGSSLFNVSFTPREIADAPHTQHSFVFAVPISGAQAARLSSLRLSGQGRETVRTTSPAKVGTAQVRRSPGGKVAVRWDARTHPMVMVRDAQTGEVLSFARGGSVDVVSFKREVDLVVSDGVKSSVKRVAVAQE